MIASPFLSGVWLVRLVIRKRGARGVGIKEEQVGILNPHEVVRCGGPSTEPRSWLALAWCQIDGNVPRYPHRLGVFQRCLQSVPVNRGDLLDSQAEAKKDKCWLELPGFTACELNELIFVDVGGIICHVDFELGNVALGRQDPARLGSEGASVSRGWIHTECTGQLPTDQTIPRDISHMTRRHAEQIDVLKMEPRGGRRIALIASILHPADHLFARLDRRISWVGL